MGTNTTSTLSDRLEELARRVEALDGDDWQTRYDIASAFGWSQKQVGQVIAWYAPGDPFMKAGPPKWLTSIDAAMTLVPGGYCVSAMGEVPDDLGWYVNLWQDGGDEGEPEVRARTAPLAICAAALRALATLQDGGEG